MKFGIGISNSGAGIVVEMDEEVSQEGGYLQPKEQQAGRPSGGAGQPHIMAKWPLQFPNASFGGDSTRMDGGEVMEVKLVVEWKWR